MARKSDCEAWLMKRYGIDQSTAHEITNDITESDRSFTIDHTGVYWNEYRAGRPAPHPWEYEGITFEMVRRPKTR